MLLLAAIIFIRRKRRTSAKQLNEESPNTPEVPLTTFENKDSVKITTIKDIKVGKRLGGGNFSDVYKGEWQVNFLIMMKKF